MRRLVAVGIAFLSLTAPAAAATQVVTFDDLPAGTLVADQYKASKGVYFQANPGFLPHVDSAPAQAHSSPNVADISTCAGCESFHPSTRGYLTATASTISVYVGYLPNAGNPGDTAQVQLTAYDAGGGVVGQTPLTAVTEGAPFTTQLTVTAPASNIAFFDIAAPQAGDESEAVAFDDLAVTYPGTTGPPDF